MLFAYLHLKSMSSPPSFARRRLAALSCAGLYSTVSLLSSTVFFWLIDRGMAPAFAQVDPLTEPAFNSQPSPQQLLEDARRRLQDQRALPELQPLPGTAPFPLPSDGAFDTYRLGPGDSLFVSVQRPQELSFQATLDLEGNVIVPLAGGISLEGLTLPEAQERIRNALDRFVINPQISLSLVAQRPVAVTILGEVFRPGQYPLPAPQLSVALVSAGGTTGLADLRTVKIRRTIQRNGGPEVIERNIDLFSPLDDATALPEVRLENGDIIVVPTLTASALETYDRSLVARSTLAQPFINVRVLNYTTGIANLTLPNGSEFLDAFTSISPNINQARLDRVALIRFDVEDGRAVTREIDARSALLGDFSENPPLQHNDVIVVGRNLIARISYALNTFTQPFRDVLGFLLFFDALSESSRNLFGPGDGRNRNR